MNEVTVISHSEFGLEETKALEITNGLKQIIEERNALSERYAEAIQLEITKENIPLFKELRLKIRDNRTKGIENWHKTQKEFYLRGGQFVDAIKRKESEENLRMESNLEENEKFFERQEAWRVAKLNKSRVFECEQYSEFVPIGVNLGSLSDDEYAKIFNGAKMQYDAKIQAEKEAEEKRLEDERIEAERIKEEKRIEDLHQSRKSIALPFYDFWDEFEKTLHFGVVSENDFNAFIDRVKKEKEENDKKIEAQRIENDRLKKEAEKAEAERKKQAEIQAKKDAENEAKLLEERKERERVEAELNAKREAELKEQQEKAEAERLAKLQAEKDAKAPVKKQLKNWVDSFELPKEPISNETSAEIIAKFEAFKAWSKTQIENL